MAAVYGQRPTRTVRRRLEQRFDELFTQHTRYQGLNQLLQLLQLLQRLYRQKSQLLLVLERPEIALHTNDSERDIRDFVKKRKVSGGDSQ